MAFLFASASSQYLIGGSAPVTAEPLTMACWFRAASAIDGQCLFQLGSSAGSARYQISANASTGSVLVIKASDGGTSGISTNSFAFTVGQWVHIAAVFTSTTSRVAYINGAIGTPNTTSITTATPDRILVGARLNTGVSQFTNGEIAETGIWNAALGAEEIAQLAKWYTPARVRSRNLMLELRLIRTLQDLRRGLAMTNTNGATIAPHPRIIG